METIIVLERLLLHRLLEDDGDVVEVFEDDDTDQPGPVDDDPTFVHDEDNGSTIVLSAPTVAPVVPPPDNESHRVLLLSVLIMLFLLAGWIIWNRVQKRNEQRRLDYRSAQADRVLGDMQMVPNADLDNELL
jgi:hypothetical protein